MKEAYKLEAKKLCATSDCPGLKCLNLSGQNPAVTGVDRTPREKYYLEVYKAHFKTGAMRG